MIEVITILLLIINLGRADTVIAETAPVAKETVQEMISRKATEMDVDPKLALRIANCESSFVPQQSKIINPRTGEREKSFGIWQIHIPSHPDVSIEQAMDPEWSTDWAMPRLKDNPNLWSCFSYPFP